MLQTLIFEIGPNPNRTFSKIYKYELNRTYSFLYGPNKNIQIFYQTRSEFKQTQKI